MIGSPHNRSLILVFTTGLIYADAKAHEKFDELEPPITGRIIKPIVVTSLVTEFLRMRQH
ncbi:hypothetical protein AYO40_03860 [Planctomycetaceae bacterium SCGC AG-212-D15]|nr:hypothetical protein AYO40_03860 [Planctomycetaceae bacterium SCGC AG-212-D15]